MSITGYHQQAHFKCNELVLYFNMQPPDEDNFQPCPHIEKLRCSRAEELAPDKCRTERKCELLENKSAIFRELGIHGPSLMKLDEELRKKRSS